MPFSHYNEKIIFFDGVCILCNSSVDYILKKDRKKILKFASIQSQFAEDFLHKLRFDISIFDTIVFYDNGKIYIKSDAVLKICRYLGFPFSAAVMLRIIPGKVRDFIYDQVARTRYKLFKKRQTCRIPESETAGRILG